MITQAKPAMTANRIEPPTEKLPKEPTKKPRAAISSMMTTETDVRMIKHLSV